METAHGRRFDASALPLLRLSIRCSKVFPFGMLEWGGMADGMPVFTKAGGFGAEDALVRVVRESQEMTKPVLAFTLGDVAGIGPEIAAKTLLRHPEVRDDCVPVVIGDIDAMRAAVALIGRNPSAVRAIGDPRKASNDPDLIEVIQTGSSLASVPVGAISAAAGDAAYRFIVEACALAKRGKVDAIVTAPLSKAALHAGGHKWPGHTELLAHEFGVKNFSLVLSSGELYFFI